ncbi:MAG: VWA domain-containing protein [Candidatus Poribacteria bacterium]|nr:VWA domain-containing protein [Candidatus Poribacteria bacterium]
MKNRKTASPYFVCSFLIHCVLLLVIWQFVPKEGPLPPPFREKIEALITHVKPLQRPVKPPVFIEPTAPIVAEEEKPPAPPKPKAGLSASWQRANQDAATPKLEARRQDSATHTSEVGSGVSHADPIVGKPTYTPENLLTLNSLAQPIAAQPPTAKVDYVVPQGETKPIALETEGVLDGSGASPGIETPKIHYGSERGDALRAGGMGNSWGGGGSSGGANLGGAFVYMMQDIARTLAAATTTQKVDIIFVLDETGSMLDNIRSVRAYADFLFEAMEREGRDATFGLVTFTDKTKAYGRTDNLETFKNWLFKIKIDEKSGGDLAEAGLDGLMAAVKASKFRKGAQRFIVLASDGAFHDADYDGKSAYSLDEVIETLQNEQVRVDVIGIDYLPIRQIALATGGTWRAIPGTGNAEYTPPLALTVKLFSKLGTLRYEKGQMDDKITVYINNPPRPKQLTLTWKVLNPLGERCYGPFREEKTVPDDGSTEVELTPVINKEVFQTMSGVYTIIYRLENEHGHRSILRRTLTF